MNFRLYPVFFQQVSGGCRRWLSGLLVGVAWQTSAYLPINGPAYAQAPGTTQIRPVEASPVEGDAQAPAIPAANLSGPLRIVKLLWKANPRSAASTLANSIATATQRNELPALRQALAGLQAETSQVVTSGDRGDPRFAAALTAHLLTAKPTPESSMIATALAELESIDQRLVLWQVWLSVEPAAALQTLSHSLAGNSLAGADAPHQPTDIAWQIAMIGQALRTERASAQLLLFEHWSQLSPAAQLAAIEPMTATVDSMRTLIQHVVTGKVSKDLVNTNQLRKWLAADNQEIIDGIEAIWGKVRATDNAARAELVATTLAQINQGAQGSVARGAAIFDRVCSQCHVLHGKGFEVGPNIVGNGRGNLQQLVSNILDPSLVIGEAFQAKTVLTVDGEVVTGLVAAENERYLKLKVQGGKTVEFDKQDVEQIKSSGNSLMPEGVESQMQPQELFDLVAYLCLLKPLDATDNELIPGTPENFVQP
jgi:putative heme-binding domain-containing protein